jgi:hypothetical protein
LTGSIDAARLAGMAQAGDGHTARTAGSASRGDRCRFDWMMPAGTRRFMLLLTSVVALAAGQPAASSSDWSPRGGGTWVIGNGVARQADVTVTDPGVKKFVVAALSTGGDQEIVAQVRVDSFPSDSSRIGVSLRSDLGSGRGYNFILLPGNRVGFLADAITFGNTCTYQWAPGQWYWMKLSIAGGVLNGRIWADGQSESQGTSCSQTGWQFYASGAPGLNGGAFGETASFNNVAIGPFLEDFNAGAPPARRAPSAGILTSRQFLTQVQSDAAAQGFDLTRFTNIMQATAQNLVCDNNPSACTTYTPGTFTVVPSAFYGGGMWMRDSAWTVAAIDNAGFNAAQTSRFAAAGNGASGQIATLLINGGGPWFGAGGQGNPLPDDDSGFMFVLAARFGWVPVASQPYLNNVYQWIKSHATADGQYRATSFGWADSFYPLGTSGPASVTVSAHMQGLYAVALRALSDLGVSVPQAEIDRANLQYNALTIGGRLRAFATSDIVDVSSLTGDALSLFIWDEPILSDAIVQNTIASFAEVYDASGNFVGYKVLSNADRSFLPAAMFPVENNGLGTPGGTYQNGASWFLYDALALYAGARHNLPGARPAYVAQLVKRFASELRAGPGTSPANASNEFICTAAGLPGDPCVAGRTDPMRAGYGWNAFVVRLLSDTAPTPGGLAVPFGVIDTPSPGAANLTGSIAVTGWALDDDEVTGVRILRDPVAGEPAGPPIFLGNAVMVEGARPDVAAAYPSYPHSTRAGWGYLLLSNMLPNGGTGTYTLYVYADDRNGHSTLLGTRTVSCANASATRPFGAIDTPGQGETVSGSAYVNFGWALTPQPKGIPFDGSTITVFVDGAPVGHPIYNNFRADIAALFPGRVNSNGAVGAFYLDTTKLADGLHTIEWLVTDNAGISEGIGSRYFRVKNGGG